MHWAPSTHRAGSLDWTCVESSSRSRELAPGRPEDAEGPEPGRPEAEARAAPRSYPVSPARPSTRGS